MFMILIFYFKCVLTKLSGNVLCSQDGDYYKEIYTKIDLYSSVIYTKIKYKYSNETRTRSRQK